jgi:hypothetical protein
LREGVSEQRVGVTIRYPASPGATLGFVRLVPGKVENGRVVLPEGEFEEGAAFAVLASAPDDPLRLTPAEEKR